MSKSGVLSTKNAQFSIALAARAVLPPVAAAVARAQRTPITATRALAAALATRALVARRRLAVGVVISHKVRFLLALLEQETCFFGNQHQYLNGN